MGKVWRSLRPSVICLAAGLVAGWSGCVGAIGDKPPDPTITDPNATPETAPVETHMVRLTAPQVRNTYRALFGEPLVMPDLPQDDQLYGFTSLSAATKTIAPVEAERYEDATYAVLDQVWNDTTRRDALVGCPPSDLNARCVRDFVEDFTTRAWRRPATAAEIDALMDLANRIGASLTEPDQGLRFALAAVLQSPHFLFRVATGEPDADSGWLRFDSWEMAARLSYLITDGPPDAELREIAAADELLDPEEVRAQAQRLVDTPEARAALVRFFRDFMNIGRLDQLDKDLDLFPMVSETLGVSMRREIERLFENVVFEKEGDFRQLFTTRETYVNGDLAPIYGIEGIEGPDFVPVTLPDDGKRGGLLTTPGFLALNAHKTESSPTHRGRFVRISLLCQDVPPPPPGVDTTLPEPSGEPQTLRQRLAAHAEDAACAPCHKQMDPIGFGFENYDAVGAWRDTEHDLPIDAVSDLDGADFEGGVELGELVAELPRVGDCIARRFYQHATTHLDGLSERAYVDDLVERFVQSDFDFKALVVEMVVNGGFRYAVPAEEGS